MARQVHRQLNLTVFHGGIFDTSEAIQIQDSRGMALVFERMPPGYEFDWDKECLYAGQQLQDGLQICIQQQGGAIVAGWSFAHPFIIIIIIILTTKLLEINSVDFMYAEHQR